MRVSVIIPIYNVEPYIRECLKSVLSQTLKEIEIILVNDGTKDKSMQVIGDLIENHSQIKVINQQNAGLSAARNSGIKHASAEYVAFLDSDDYLEEDFLEKLYREAKKNNLDIACGGITRFFEDSQRLEVQERQENLVNGQVQSGVEFLLAQFMEKNYKMEVVDDLYKTSFLKENGLEFFEGLLHEDEEFTPRTLIKAKRVMLVETYGYFYRKRENSIMTSGISERTITSLEKILFQYRDMFETTDEKIEKEALSWLILYLSETFIDRLNISKLKDRHTIYERLSLDKLLKIITYSAQMSKKQKIKFSALKIHYKLFELIADTQKRVKRGGTD